MNKAVMKGRVVENIEVDGVDSRDYPDFCDAYFSYAEWADTNEPLTDDELEQLLEENYDVLYEMAFESFI